MPCVACKAPTSLQVNGVPLCLACGRAAATSQVTTRSGCVRPLTDEEEFARASREQLAHFVEGLSLATSPAFWPGTGGTARES